MKLADPPLPFAPETVGDARARVPAALEPPIHVDAILEGSTPPRRTDRRYVFDFYDGLRLRISHSRADDVEAIHVAASARRGTTAEQHAWPAFFALVGERLREIGIEPSGEAAVREHLEAIHFLWPPEWVRISLSSFKEVTT